MTTFATVCTGIGAPEVAWEFLGWTPLWMAEIEAAPSSVLAHHWPRVPNMGDMTKLPDYMRWGLLPAPDVLCGGTPCQAYSLAGLRQGLDDPRGQLTLKFVELADAIDSRRPAGDECVVVWENVPGVLSDGTNAFGHFLAGLAGEDVPLVVSGGKWPNAGAVVGPARAIAWRIVDAQYFGVAQRRRRVLVVASARDGFDPAAVLFEFDGLRRDSAPRREAREETAVGTLRSTDGGCDVDHARAGHVLACVSNAEGSTGLPFLTCSNIGKTVNNQTPLLVEQRVPCFAMQAGVTRQNPNSGPDGVGVQTDIAYTLEARAEVQIVAQPIAFSCKDYGADASVDLAPTMRAMGHAGSHANAGGQLAVCVTGDVTHTLKAEGFDASEDGTGRGQPIVPVYAMRESGPGYWMPDDLAGTLRAEGENRPSRPSHVIAYRPAEPRPIWRVRRLTPKECERLQGFPDNHTLVPHRGKPMADGPRYKALGNSMCVYKMRWLGERIQQFRRIP